MANPFLGEIRAFPFNFAPKGWAFCDGQLMPISQYTALFSLLGTSLAATESRTSPCRISRATSRWILDRALA